MLSVLAHTLYPRYWTKVPITGFPLFARKWVMQAEWTIPGPQTENSPESSWLFDRDPATGITIWRWSLGFEVSLEQQHDRMLQAAALKTPIKRNVHHWRRPVCVARWVWIVMLTLSGSICGADAQAADVEEPFRVMILRNTSQYLPAGILQDRGMREAFGAKGPGRVEFRGDNGYDVV